MTFQNIPEESDREDAVLQVLALLSKCERSSAELTKREHMANWLARWGLIVSAGLTVVNAGLAFWHVNLHTLPYWLQWAAVAVSLLAIGIALLALIAPIVASAVSLLSWKKPAF
ncbi:hypothetical protein [Pseudomonas matsuisoli]|uniref:Uncharacterized protein n=1 Tax=Pseudomonas matsuisoli TaxID=1515666 RepID=A0A917PZE6_9PSED|nr:hypothetical protein [Pseudomonas matsuisoli]GGK02603.1 hypothetical protein GCM10009304_30520 [Pseudomonas matsuisoli]